MAYIKLRINADNEHDLCRVLARLGSLVLAEDMAEAHALDTPPDAPPPAETPPSAAASEPEPKKRGRPAGSTNKPKTNGGEPQTEAQTQGGAPNGLLPLTEQIQIITDAAHDQPDKLKPLLAPLREKLGVQYISKAAEKDRPALQEFINEHGLAV